MARLANIEKAEKVGARKNYYANQTRHIRQVLKRAERRERISKKLSLKSIKNLSSNDTRKKL